MKLLHLYLALLVSVLLTSCFKDPIFKPVEPKLPEATQEGLNTFGCYKNGELWLVSSTFYGPTLNAQLNYKNNDMFIGACNTGECLQIWINIDSATLNKKIFLADSVNFVDCLDYDRNCVVRNIRSESSYVILSQFDTVNQIISGEFQFYFPDSCGVSNSFTEGRFDLEFNKN